MERFEVPEGWTAQAYRFGDLGLNGFGLLRFLDGKLLGDRNGPRLGPLFGHRLDHGVRSQVEDLGFHLTDVPVAEADEEHPQEDEQENDQERRPEENVESFECGQRSRKG